MKKKGVLIAGVVGFVAVVSLFARQTQDFTGGGGCSGPVVQSKLYVPPGLDNEQTRAYFENLLENPNLAPGQREVFEKQIEDLIGANS